MITVRRLKRNVRRFLIPFEAFLLWTVGPVAAVLYWLFHGAMHGARYASAIITHWRF